MFHFPPRSILNFFTKINYIFFSDICGKNFTQKFYVKEHMDAIHLGIKKFSCSICGLAFSRRRVWLVHLNTHQDDSKKKCICEICGYRCFTNQLLFKHIRSHSGEKNFPCSICHKKFSTNYAAKVHVNSVHLGIKQKVEILCFLCGKKFSRQKLLRNHQLSQHAMVVDEFNSKIKGKNDR